MTDYISRQEAIHEISGNITITGSDNAMQVERFLESAFEAIKRLPTADVRENVKGEWKADYMTSTTGMTFMVHRCSICEQAMTLPNNNFCPNCGADMRKT